MQAVIWMVVGSIGLAYTALMLLYRLGWDRVPHRTSLPAGGELPACTILVPARNEAEQIPHLLRSLVQQQYPAHLLEVLVIDDGSTDQTAAVAASFREQLPGLRVLQAEGSGKKQAIATGVAAASHEWLLTTDADCTMGPHWLQSMLALASEEVKFIAGPVHMAQASGLLALFQTIDFMGMQGITAASVQLRIHSMCNGANLAYRKSAFTAVGGFSGIDQVPTGDDMLLMHKIARAFDGSTLWLQHPSAIVFTEPCDSWRAFFQQRIRWGSKATVFEDRRIFWALLAVYVWNVVLLVALVGACFLPAWRLPLLVLFGVKMMAEAPLMWGVSGFFGARRLLVGWVLLQPWHVIYMVIAGWLGQFGSYQWKGRKVATRMATEASKTAR